MLPPRRARYRSGDSEGRPDTTQPLNFTRCQRTALEEAETPRLKGQNPPPVAVCWGEKHSRTDVLAAFSYASALCDTLLESTFP